MQLQRDEDENQNHGPAANNMPTRVKMISE